MKEELFLSTLIVLVLFNVGVVMINPSQVSILNVDVSGFILSVLSIAVVGGIKVFDTGLSDSSINILVGAIILFNIMYQIEIEGFTLGFGLITTVFNVFNTGDILGYGTLFASILSLIMIFTGMLILVEK